MARSRKQDKTVTEADIAAATAGKENLEGDFHDRMVELFEQRRGLNIKISTLSQEIKDAGCSSKVIKAMANRTLETDEQRTSRLAFQAELDDLEQRLGAFVRTPLGQAAMGAAA